MNQNNNLNTNSKLCNSCGLCCDGSLFTSVDLTEEEFSKLPDKVLNRDLKLHQPCYYYNGRCDIYNSRPLKCRQFECKLLKNLTGGKVKFDEALNFISKARDLQNKTLSTIKNAPNDVSAATTIRDYISEHGHIWEKDAPDSQIKNHVGFLMAFAELRSYLSKYFYVHPPIDKI